MENIRQKILDIRTARDKKAFVNYFVEHPTEIDVLAEFVFKLEEYPYKEYASWILMHICKSGKIDVQYLYPRLVDLVFKTQNQTVLRNVVNSISHLKVTDYRETDFIDQLIDFIKNFDNKVAVQVHAIYTLIQFVERHPELRHELVEIIEFHSKGKTVAYMVAMKRFQAQLVDK